MADVLDTLRKLYALTASPNEHEARTAAWLLVTKARAAGVTIVFQKGAEPAAPAGPSDRLRACIRCGKWPAMPPSGVCVFCWGPTPPEPSRTGGVAPERRCGTCGGPLESNRTKDCNGCLERWANARAQERATAEAEAFRRSILDPEPRGRPRK